MEFPTDLLQFPVTLPNSCLKKKYLHRYSYIYTPKRRGTSPIKKAPSSVKDGLLNEEEKIQFRVFYLLHARHSKKAKTKRQAARKPAKKEKKRKRSYTTTTTIKKTMKTNAKKKKYGKRSSEWKFHRRTGSSFTPSEHKRTQHFAANFYISSSLPRYAAVYAQRYDTRKKKLHSWDMRRWHHYR